MDLKNYAGNYQEFQTQINLLWLGRPFTIAGLKTTKTASLLHLILIIPAGRFWQKSEVNFPGSGPRKAATQIFDFLSNYNSFFRLLPLNINLLQTL